MGFEGAKILAASYRRTPMGATIRSVRKKSGNASPTWLNPHPHCAVSIRVSSSIAPAQRADQPSGPTMTIPNRNGPVSWAAGISGRSRIISLGVVAVRKKTRYRSCGSRRPGKDPAVRQERPRLAWTLFPFGATPPRHGLRRERLFDGNVPRERLAYFDRRVWAAMVWSGLTSQDARCAYQVADQDRRDHSEFIGHDAARVFDDPNMLRYRI